MSSDKNYVPKLLTTKDVSKLALDAVKLESSGAQLGLKSRYGKLNVALGKYFRFGTVTSINGLSGSGKSYLLNLLIQDFTNPLLNSKCIYDYLVAAHSFEMRPEDEILRTVSSKLKKSYQYLLSSEYDADNRKYNTLTKEEIDEVEKVLKTFEDRPLYYFSEPTTLSGIGKNIRVAIERYKDENKTLNTPKIIIPIDHTLLIKQSKGEKGILETMRALAALVIGLKKKGYMIIMLGQLNNNIERVERVRDYQGHYPIKSDIYAQGEIFNACDNVLTIHQPELLGILSYGKNQYDTAGLVHLQILKQRFGKIGSIWLQNNLAKGTFVNYKPTSLSKENK